MTVAELYKTLEYGPAPEAAGPALAWIEDHDGTFANFIGNQWVQPAGGEYFDTLNPGTGRPLARVPQSAAEDVDRAVAAARKAAGDWAVLSGHARARHLYAIARRIQKNSRLFAVLESLDNGKPIRETRDIDIPLVARHFYYHAGWAQIMETELPDYAPVGVVGQIIPWNFPLLMLAWKIAPALAMGNTVVLKPAEFTPLTALLFAEIVEQSGLPPGVVNIITGDGRTGEALVKSPVDKIAFTGSTDVGRAIRRETAGSGKRLSLELGGKSPFVVFDDADLDSVVEGLVDAIWFNQGQVCCAGSRLLIQESVETVLLDKLRRRMETLRIGDPLDKAVDIGAIIAPVQLQRIEALVQQGVEEGAEMWQPSWACPTEGFFYPPTLFTNVSPSATIAQVEIFGPVLVSMTFRTPAEAVALANNTRYGLAASIWSESINLALDTARQVKAGSVWINCTNMFDAASGFGGYRESGYGREGGREGLYEYIRLRDPENRKHGSQLNSLGVQFEESGDGTEAHPGALNGDLPNIDRTPKLYIGGKQARPDSGYSRDVLDRAGTVIAEVADGNRKDIRNAVEAAHGATGWMWSTAHARAQVLYYIAENLGARRAEFANRLSRMLGSHYDGLTEVDAAIDRLFTFAAWTDKYDGEVHQTPFRNMTIAVNEGIGVVGIICPDEAPLLAFITPLAAAIAMGNAVVAVPSEPHPLSATDLYQVFDTSDLPGGVVNIVTGARKNLLPVLAAHDDVDAMWCWAGADECRQVEYESAGNMKRTWTHATPMDWTALRGEQVQEFLREATQVKNIWTPYGE
ncbi:MAG TPA: aldehyde dehydrogenase family protein [Chloroflexota bacterium]|jgi:aldehyde dehydrogenase (NAD+)|nr:aldehyde dehydrogenase family protein [Chloroflexota bacterium]